MTMTIKKFRKPSKIFYTANGRAFIRHYNERLYLEDFETLHNNPWRGAVDDELKDFDGIMSLTVYSGYLVKFIENYKFTGETVIQLFYYYN